jgi:hypothetical protein
VEIILQNAETYAMNVNNGYQALPDIVQNFMHVEVAVCLKSSKSSEQIQRENMLAWNQKYLQITVKSGYEINQIKDVQRQLSDKFKAARAEIDKRTEQFREHKRNTDKSMRHD